MDNFRDSYFQVDWDLTSRRLRGTFWGKQYDTGRGFAVTVINGGQVVTATNEVLRLKWEKPDKTTGYVNATIVDGKFVIENIDQMFTVHGNVRADFELSVAGESLASVTFYVSVEKAVAVDAIESSSDFTALQDALADVGDMQAQVDAVIANATVDSEVILARGTEATLGARLDSITKGGWNLKNEIVNGDFSTPDISHITSTLDLEVVEGRLKASKSNWTYTSGATIIIQNAYNSWDAGDKYYVKAMLKVVGDTQQGMHFGSYDGQGILVLSANDYRELNSVSMVFSPPTKNFAIRHFLKSAEYVEIILDNFVSINLTKTFGSGNEPSKEEMDELLELLGGWFEGTAKEGLVTLWKFATSSNSGTLDSILTTENEPWEVI